MWVDTKCKIRAELVNSRAPPTTLTVLVAASQLFHAFYICSLFFCNLLTLRRRVAIVFPNSPFLSKLDIPRIALSYQKWDSRHIMWCPGGSLLKTALSKPRSYIEYKCVFSLPLLLHSSNNKRTPSFYDAPTYPCVNTLFLPWSPFVFWYF